MAYSNSNNRKVVHIDNETYQRLLILRNYYSQRDHRNVSLAAIIKMLSEQHSHILAAQDSVFKIFFGVHQ
ncbi:MAG: hypothetical protein QXU98_11470 [Candidatus Parvarchaeota archaeon]